MMDFKEFTTRAEQDIRAALEDASPGVGVGMNQVEKLQGESYTAIEAFLSHRLKLKPNDEYTVIDADNC